MIQVLEFDSIEFSYGDRKILSSIHVRCHAGEIIGLLGRNGSGKSTLMKVVSGALHADHQSIRINGVTIRNQIGQKQITYLPQENLIPPFLTIRKAMKLCRVDIKEVLKSFPEIELFLPLKPFEVSGGYLRVIEALLVLKSSSPFCILDEPFTGLMPLHIETMKSLIREAKKTKGVVITDHLYRQVISIADRFYLLNNGQTYLINNEAELITRGYIHHL
jgi:ABC-type multidrug transport system ATPase subunit